MLLPAFPITEPQYKADTKNFNANDLASDAASNGIELALKIVLELECFWSDSISRSYSEFIVVRFVSFNCNLLV